MPKTQTNSEFDYEAQGSSRSGRFSNLGATASQQLDNSPLIAVGAGAALGAVLGAVLPTSRKEKELLAPVGDRVRTSALGAVDAARQVGSDKLRELGLTPDAVAEKVSEAGRATAQAALGRFRDDSGNS